MHTSDATSSVDGPESLDAAGPIDAAPPDACMPLTEICDGMDNDCDGHIAEGFDVGMACDGVDTDLCAEGHIVCAVDGTAMCNDFTGNNVEPCNGFDDDCNNGIDDSFPVGQACAVGLGVRAHRHADLQLAPDRNAVHRDARYTTDPRLRVLCTVVSPRQGNCSGRPSHGARRRGRPPELT